MTARLQHQRTSVMSATGEAAGLRCPMAGRSLVRAAVVALAVMAGAGTSGCATTGGGGGGMGRAGSVAQDAMTQPLRDFGLVRPVIAPELARIVDPYAPSMGPGCSWLMYELSGLERVLGTEAARAGDQRRTSGEQIGAAAEGAVRGAVSDLIPARGLVRQLSGAEAADRALRAAQERGRVRRAFLMGLAHAEGCRRPPDGTPPDDAAPTVTPLPPALSADAAPPAPAKP